MCLSRPDPPPMRPTPPEPELAEKPTDEVKNVETAKRKKVTRRGGAKSYTINRTSPNTGSQGAGARMG